MAMARMAWTTRVEENRCKEYLLNKEKQITPRAQGTPVPSRKSADSISLRGIRGVADRICQSPLVPERWVPVREISRRTKRR